MSLAVPESAVPTVSVLLPVYNAEPFLREAVESVLSQSFGDFELLAIDDGSTDGSLRILREYEAKDKRMRVCSRANRGATQTRNELIIQARGTYIAAMDADDICMPRRFERQVAFLDGSPNHIVVGGWFELMGATGLPIGIHRNRRSHSEIDQANLKGYTSICHPAAMLRKTAVVQVGCYRTEFPYAQDLDLWLRLAEIGEVANIPEVLLRYRLHPNSVSETHGQKQQDSARRACESAWQRRGVKGRYEATDYWRPGQDRASRYKFALQYGWISWNNGHRKTWWTFAWKALRLQPFARSSWQLLIFGCLRKPGKEVAPEH